MIPQDGDHFAHPHDNALAHVAYSYARARHLGLPDRTRADEDRAQEARQGARAIRSIAMIRILDGRGLAGMSSVTSRAARRFVPRPQYSDHDLCAYATIPEVIDACARWRAAGNRGMMR